MGAGSSLCSDSPQVVATNGRRPPRQQSDDADDCDVVHSPVLPLPHNEAQAAPWGPSSAPTPVGSSLSTQNGSSTSFLVSHSGSTPLVASAGGSSTDPVMSLGSMPEMGKDVSPHPTNRTSRSASKQDADLTNASYGRGFSKPPVATRVPATTTNSESDGSTLGSGTAPYEDERSAPLPPPLPDFGHQGQSLNNGVSSVRSVTSSFAASVADPDFAFSPNSVTTMGDNDNDSRRVSFADPGDYDLRY